MREALSLDGWFKEEMLPKGWWVKRHNLNNMAFLTDRGDLLRSQEDAIQYISNNLHRYGITEINQIKRFMEEIKHWVKPKKKMKKSKVWTEEKFLPGAGRLAGKAG